MTVREHTIIRLAARPWVHLAARDDAVLEELSLSPARFSQLVSVLIDRPDVEAAYPVETHRLRRLRDRRRQQRRGVREARAS